MKIFISNKARKLPGHVRAPDEKGINEYCDQCFPSGVLLKGDSGSNLSGINSFGFYHWLGLTCKA